MKGIDFFNNLNQPLKITLSEEQTAKLSEIELPDELQAKFSEVFISKERAKNDDDIIKHIVTEDRKKNFKIVDEKIKTFLPFISAEDAAEIEKKFLSYEKLDMLVPALEKAQKAKGSKISEDVQKMQEDYVQKLKDKDEAHKRDLVAMEQRFQELQFEFVVKDKLKGYKLSEAAQSFAEKLPDLAMIDLKKQPYKYELENGSIAIYKESKDGVKSYAYQENSEEKLTLEKLLDKFVDPFVAKSQGNGSNGKDNGKQEPPKQPQTPNGNKEGLSLRELMQLDAAKSS